MPVNERTNRPIRMNDAEWSDFKLLLGAEWLRGQIAKARAKADRRDVSVK